METIEDALLKRQIDSELKNAMRSEERKKKQKRKLSEKDKNEPPKKKEKKSTTIPLSVKDVEAIRDHFWTTVVYLPLLDKVALYSGLTNETMSFAAYPILLGPVQKKDGKSTPIDYILGVSRPPVILTGLRDLFKKLYPDKNNMDFQQWDVYRWNRAYYTVKTEKTSWPQELLELQMVETKPFGGPKDPSCVHWLEESKLKRWGKAISLEAYFKDKEIARMKRSRIPANAKPWAENHLHQINEKVEALKRSLLIAEETSRRELSKKDIAEAMKNLKDDSDNDDDSSEDSDECA